VSCCCKAAVRISFGFFWGADVLHTLGRAVLLFCACLLSLLQLSLRPAPSASGPCSLMRLGAYDSFIMNESSVGLLNRVMYRLVQHELRLGAAWHAGVVLSRSCAERPSVSGDMRAPVGPSRLAPPSGLSMHKLHGGDRDLRACSICACPVNVY